MILQEISRLVLVPLTEEVELKEALSGVRRLTQTLLENVAYRAVLQEDVLELEVMYAQILLANQEQPYVHRTPVIVEAMI